MKSFKWDGFIDDSVIINLKDRTDRRELLDDRLKYIKIDEEKTLKDCSRYFDAIDTTMLNEIPNDIVKREYPFDSHFDVHSSDEYEHLYGQGKLIKTSDTEIACAYSHYLIWKNIVDKGISTTLIMEDDVSFTNNFVQNLYDVFKNYLPSNFDLLYLSYSHTNNCKMEKVNDYLNRIYFGLWTTAGYILTYNGAKKLLTNLPIIGSADIWLNHQFQDLDVYAFDNPIMIHEMFETPTSNIWSYSDYCYQNSPHEIFEKDLKSNKFEALMYNKNKQE